MAIERRCLGCWEFEGGGRVEIIVSGDITTERALAWAEKLIARKREELAEIDAELAPRAGAGKED